MTIELVEALSADVASLILVDGNIEAAEHSAPACEHAHVEASLAHAPFLLKNGEAMYSIGSNGQPIFITGIKTKGSTATEALRRAIGKGLRLARKHEVKEVGICLPAMDTVDERDLVQLCAETIHLSLYEYKKYLSEKGNESFFDKVFIQCNSINDELRQALNMGEVLGDSTNITRDLVNEPSIDLYPETLANKVQELGKRFGFDVQVFDHEQCLEMDMHAFLAVGQASTRTPKLIVMRWIGGSNMEPIGLVGKGVTYDTGGLSLKPTASMLRMKSDMTGSAVVIGTMCALARMKSEKNVVGVVAACENSVAGNAFMPGDILKSKNGKTIEIRNTDAEGRLTLADAIAHAIREEHANKIIDIATLTGAVKVALGDQVAGAVTTDDSLYQHLQEASALADEQFWQLPINQDYRDLNNSDIADISNLGRDGLAGTISAACFVEAFTEGLPWLHLDIAGVAYNHNKHDYIPKGASGRVVRSLYHLVERLD